MRKTVAVCDFCGKPAVDTVSVRVSKTQKRFTVDVCATDLKRINKALTPEGNTCRYCGEAYPSSQGLAAHIRHAHGGAQ